MAERKHADGCKCDACRKAEFVAFFAQYWRLHKFYGSQDFTERLEMIKADAAPYWEIAKHGFEHTTANFRELFQFCMRKQKQFMTPFEFEAAKNAWLETKRQEIGRPRLAGWMNEMMMDYACLAREGREAIEAAVTAIQFGWRKFPAELNADPAGFEKWFRQLLLDSGLKQVDLDSMDARRRDFANKPVDLRSVGKVIHGQLGMESRG